LKYKNNYSSTLDEAGRHGWWDEKKMVHQKKKKMDPKREETGEKTPIRITGFGYFSVWGPTHWAP